VSEDLVELAFWVAILAAFAAVHWYRKRRAGELDVESSESRGRFAELELGLARGPRGRRYARLGFSVPSEDGPQPVEVLLDSRQVERLARLLRKAAGS
jgi:hypothetical protein